MKKFILSTLALAALSLPAFAQLSRYELRVYNQTSYPMTGLYVCNPMVQDCPAPAGTLPNMIGRAIPPGGSRTFDLNDGTGQCNLRLQAEFNGMRGTRGAVNVCGSEVWRVFEN